MSNQEFNKGDKVTWQSRGSTAEGTVEEKITTDKTAAKRKVRAPKDDPQYRVRSPERLICPCPDTSNRLLTFG
jgi:hypothetical protein